MRHGKKHNHLGRTTSHRRAMLANMASSLIEHKRITTTLAKAKALRVYVEPLITKSKNDTTHSRRVVFSYLQNKEVLTELFRDVAAKVATRPGGYTRIIKLENRFGDNAEMAMIELVDYNTTYTTEAPAQPEKKATRRRGGSGKAKKADTTPVAATEAVASEEEAPASAPVDEAPEAPAADESAEEKA
ncbi:MAG TPA: 50S ribosomal protein L17 [Pedobacter sp.]|jgi:large subunit ribosomal protein L17